MELEREEDVRWFAAVADLPGATVYGAPREDAVSRVEARALGVLADCFDHSEPVPEFTEVFSVAV